MAKRTESKSTKPKITEPGSSATKSGTTRGIVSLKVTLAGIKPPIWRRLMVPGTMTLGDLHDAIQAVMGWEDGHLHDFDVDGGRYGDPSTVDYVDDENSLTLNDLTKSGIARFTYTYDFGDDWEHMVAIEKTSSVLDGKSYPTCVAGARNCPPEDCGGPWGYQHLLEVLADPAHPEHAEQIEWLGEEFDPNNFSVEYADATLGARFNRK
jgi:hypothetical protein